VRTLEQRRGVSSTNIFERWRDGDAFRPAGAAAGRGAAPTAINLTEFGAPYTILSFAEAAGAEARQGNWVRERGTGFRSRSRLVPRLARSSEPFLDMPLMQPSRSAVTPFDPSAAPSLATLRGVDKVFANKVEALRDVNIVVREGEFLSLLGPSGCGKSTVLRLLSGLTPPTRGAIEWRGERPTLGFVFQEPTLMPWATVFSNVWLPLRLNGVSKDKARPRVEEVLEMVGLSGFAKAYPRELSGGMKMRASIARALVTRPAVLLMDEPFAALDEITRTKLNDELVSLKCALRATVIFVTHSVIESVYLSNRIVIFAPRPGRAVAEIHVDAPLPRDAEFRMSPAYAQKCRETSLALHEAMAKQPEAEPGAKGPRP
jgi:NitT/TauT family transport system ATP-binding protein